MRESTSQPQAVKSGWAEPEGYRPPGQAAYSRVPSAVATRHRSITICASFNDLSIQAFIPQLCVEALTVAVLPGTPWLDIENSSAQFPEPVPQFLGDELGPVVRTDVLGLPTSANTSMTSALPNRLATRIARHSRVYSSSSTSNRRARPSWVIAFTKS